MLSDHGPTGPIPLLLSALVLGASVSPHAASLDEESFLRQVLLKNPSVQAESLTVEAAKATREGANSLLLPQFNVGAKAGSSTDFDGSNGYSGQGSGTASQLLPTGGTLAASALAGKSHAKASPLGTVDGDTAGVQIAFTQPFLRGFGDGNDTFYNIDQARAAVKIQTFASRGTVLATLSSARQAWWNQRAKEAALVARVQDSVRTRRLLDNAKTNQASGAGSVLDTIQAFADHLQARSDWFSAWTAAHAAAVELGSYLDTTEMWIGDPLHDTTLALPSDSVVPPAWSSVDSLMRLAEAGAPDLAEALATEDKAKSEKLYRDRQTLPSLDGGVYARKAFLPDGSNKNVVFGIQGSFNWDIPDGVNRAAARKALLDLRKAGVQAVKARHDLRRTLQKLVDQSREYAQAVELARQLAKVQDVKLAAAEQGYRDGASSWADLVQARHDWMGAISTVWSDIYQAQQIESEIQSLTGTGPARLGWNWGE